eukprot:4081018-Ditylum_brightwellii.AAC.1
MEEGADLPGFQLTAADRKLMEERWRRTGSGSNGGESWPAAPRTGTWYQQARRVARHQREGVELGAATSVCSSSAADISWSEGRKGDKGAHQQETGPVGGGQ